MLRSYLNTASSGDTKIKPYSELWYTRLSVWQNLRVCHHENDLLLSHFGPDVGHDRDVWRRFLESH